MPGLHADVNLQGHLPYLRRLIEGLGLLDLLTELGLTLTTFPDLGLEPGACAEGRIIMSLTITLPPATEETLRQRAEERGLAPDALARLLIEQGLNGGEGVAPPAAPGTALDEVLAPFRQEVEASDITDDELRDFFTEVRDAVREEKRAARTQG